MSITDPRKQNKTAKQVKRALQKDPNDIASLLKLAVILGDSTKPDLDRKRKVLHQVLTLERSNRMARQMLLDMDRAEIGGNPARLSLAVILTDSSPALPEPPLILRYSIVHQMLVYSFIGFTMLFGLINVRDVERLPWWGALLAFLVLPLWYVTAVMEVSDDELTVSHLFGLIRSEMAWREVRQVKWTAFGQGLWLIHRSGKVLEVSAQIQGYPFILDILSQMRPDLFPNREDSGNTVQTTSAAAPLTPNRI